MNLQPISIDEFTAHGFTLFDKGWFILSAGDFAAGKFNCMTISWGGLGTMWNKPVVQVVVRPGRYTFGFIESNPDFTLCVFPAQYRRALSIIGSKSGRDGDKVREAGLTPCRSSVVSAPSFAEANLVLECRKVYADVFKPECFIDPTISEEYPDGDYHHVYLGEVQSIRGEEGLYAGR